jgi:DNA-binding transcriptional MerR regulator
MKRGIGQTMRIGELSTATGVSIATIRVYEREGLIQTASRTKGKLREFTSDQKRRLDFIKRVRDLGFSLDDVKGLLSHSGAVDVTLVDRIFDGIKIRKRDLERLEVRLSKVRAGALTVNDLDSAFGPSEY